MVCLDDVETILRRPQDFKDGFYDNLRAAMGNNQMMLIVASFEPLRAYQHSYQSTSEFFNQGQTMELKKFALTEVDTLLLWADKAQFSDQQKKRMRQWGEQHPYLLQLAGEWLWKAQSAGKNELFAKQRFEEEKQRNLYSTPLSNSSGIAKVFKPFKWLGQLAHWSAEKWHHVHLIIIGMVIVISVILAILYGLGMTIIKLGGHPFEFMTHIWNTLFGSHPEGH